MLVSEFQLAAGSVVGRNHRTTYRNCQDAYCIARSSDSAIAVIADGCGSGQKTEVGANLAVRFLSETLLQQLGESATIGWQRVQQHLLSNLDIVARQMGGNYRSVVEEYFMFTIVGVVLHGQMATFFALGDGVIIVNGDVTELGPFAGNMPPYIAYRLLQDELRIDPESIVLKPRVEIPLVELQSFAIGSDGLSDLLTVSDRPMPGLAELCGDASQFWQNDCYFGGNQELVARRLRLIGRDWPKRNPEPGLLPDDTTLVVGRRRKDA